MEAGVIILALLVFLAAQIGILFAFYRMVLRPLPTQINELLFVRHINNELTKTATDAAELLRVKLLELEEERLEAIAKYEALKGRRKITETQKAERVAFKKATENLASQISGIQSRISELYTEPPVFSNIYRIEQTRLVTVINRYLDEKRQT
ncbi:hypothetical protein KRX53_01235 [Dermabacteraceae bacterium TAE3-ERU5]|nr:hypothetical protein [Dermabacteraceae bacterium TAE3-ERU5]